MSDGRKAYRRKYYLAHREQMLEKAATWAKENPEKRRKIWKRHHDKKKQKDPKKFAAARRKATLKSRLKKKYDITLEQYEILLAIQNFCCAICLGNTVSTTAQQNDLTWQVVDHDHETGKMRGLLCRKCNTGLGSFKDNPTLLRAAADYIEHHKGNQ